MNTGTTVFYNSNQKASYRNSAIDCTKFVFSICVVLLHCQIFHEYNQILYYTFVNFIFRFAVPFFAVCSGYFLAQGFDYNKLINQLTKIAKLYFSWSLIFLFVLLPKWYVDGSLTLRNLIGFAESTLLTSSVTHLWYLIDLIYALPIFYLINKLSNKYLIIVIAIILYACGVSYFTYSIVPPIKVIGYAPFAAQLKILPLLLIGSFIKKTNLKWDNKYFLFSIAFFIIHATEGWISFNKGFDVSFVYSTLFSSIIIFLFFSSLTINKRQSFCSYLGKVSIIIYCMHPIYTMIFKSMNLNSLFVSLLSTTSVLAVSCMCNKKRIYYPLVFLSIIFSSYLLTCNYYVS